MNTKTAISRLIQTRAVAIVEAIFNAPLMLIPNVRWSALRTLGRSRIMAATILAPFVGWLLIFNATIINYLALIPSVGDHAGTDNFVPLSRLYWTYFGLIFLGIASYLFTLLCPSEIKAQGDLNTYIASEKEHMTDAKSAKYAVENMEWQTMHQTHVDGEPVYGVIPPDYAGRFRERSFPLASELDYNKVITAIYEAAFSNETMPEVERAALEETEGADANASVAEDFEPGRDTLFQSGIGLLLIDEFSECIASARRADRYFAALVEGVAPKFIVDTLRIRYAFLDYQRPLWRFAIVVLYAMGFTLLAIPSVITFVRVLQSLVR